MSNLAQPYGSDPGKRYCLRQGMNMTKARAVIDFSEK
jgi:hypothetical protein